MSSIENKATTPGEPSKLELFRAGRAGLMNSVKDDEVELSKVKPIYQKPTFNIDDAIESSNVLISEDISEPPRCLAVKSGQDIATIGTLGNISLLMGKAKGKKSFLVQLLINAAINQGDPDAFIISTLPEDKRTVLVIDTEQGRYRSQRILKRAERLAVGHTGTLIVHDLRGYNTAERLQITERLIYNTPNLGIVFIDGARDLVTSINDEEQATSLSSLFLKWTADLQIHICVVLHQNKNDAQARGHLGTELVNKAETVLSATKDPEDESKSIVQAEACRDKEFLPFAFCINKEGLPFIIPDYVHTESKGRPGAWKPEDVPLLTHKEVLNRIWPSHTTPYLKYKEFQAAIKEEFKIEGLLITDNKQEKLVRHYVALKLVVIFGEGRNKSYKLIRTEEEIKPETVIQLETGNINN